MHEKKDGRLARSLIGEGLYAYCGVPSIGRAIAQTTSQDHDEQELGAGLAYTRTRIDEAEYDGEGQEDQDWNQEQDAGNDTEHDKDHRHRDGTVPFVAHVVAVQEACCGESRENETRRAFVCLCVCVCACVCVRICASVAGKHTIANVRRVDVVGVAEIRSLERHLFTVVYQAVSTNE